MAIDRRRDDLLIGVSPAYFISRYSDRFTPAEVVDGLAAVAQLGCKGFQLEVYHREMLGQWLNGGAQRVRQRSLDLDLAATQFVAHFMMNAFADRQSLNSNSEPDDMQIVLEIVSRFNECRTITVPLGAFEPGPTCGGDDYRMFFERSTAKIGCLLEMVEKSGCRIALEIMPAAIIGGIDGFLRLCEQLGTDTLGLNFDSGHAWAAKENLYLIPAKLGQRILGTHLCDNFGHENLSLRPGAGSIDWPRIINALQAVEYTGSYDLEIICRPAEVNQEYGKGYAFINDRLNQSTLRQDIP
jgi:sugar phosphate isomerase/epimerase